MLSSEKLNKQTIFKVVLTGVMLFISILMILPFIWMLSTSFKFEKDIFTFPIQWVPQRWNFKNYTEVWSALIPFYVYYWNSVKISVISTVGCVVTSLLSAYAFARIDFKGRNLVFFLYITTLMFPNTMLLVPRLAIFRFLGLYNTHLALIIPGFISTFGTFLLRQYIMSLPNELFESARIDGCSEFKQFTRIAVPLVTAGITAFTIFTFVWAWNDYENPLMFISSRPLFTIPLGIMEFKGDKRSGIGYIMAGSVLSLIPIFVLFSFCQKYFIQGIALTGIKG